MNPIKKCSVYNCSIEYIPGVAMEAETTTKERN
jgi:hypothetical protein